MLFEKDVVQLDRSWESNHGGSRLTVGERAIRVEASFCTCFLCQVINRNQFITTKQLRLHILLLEFLSKNDRCLKMKDNLSIP